jgi:YesN/AraC family two-component response regulator
MPYTRFVILTGYGEFEYAREALLLGVEDYLLKPVYDKDLKKIVEKVQMDLMNEMKIEIQQELRLLEQSGYGIEIININFPEFWFDSSKKKNVIMGKEKLDVQDKVILVQFRTCVFVNIFLSQSDHNKSEPLRSFELAF